MSLARPLQPKHRWYAAVYDPLTRRMGEKKMAPIRRAIAGGATGAVLEIGGGTGANLAFYDWSRVESLVVVEPDPFMLKRAVTKLADLPPEARAKVTLREVAAESLPFEDGSFDCIVATLVFCTVSDLNRSLSEVNRVLKPGGSLRLAEHVASAGLEGAIQRLVQPVYGWMSADCQLNRHTEDAVRAAGFDLEVIERPRFGPLVPGFVGVATKR